MPELPPAKRRYEFHADGQKSSSESQAAGLVPYAELHCKTNFSFLEGGSHPDELVQQSAQLGYRALAITDRNSLAGVVRAHVAAKEVGLPLVIGAEVTPTDAPPILLLAMNRAGYGRLARLLTVGRRRAPKGECHLTFADVAEHSQDLIAIVDSKRELKDNEPPASTGGAQQSSEPRARNEETRLTKPPLMLSTRDVGLSPPPADAGGSLRSLSDSFRDRCYLLVERHYGPVDTRYREQMKRLSKRTGIPLVAGNDVHFHHPDRKDLQDVLTAIRLGAAVDEIRGSLQSNAERYLKSPAQMMELFAGLPDAISRTIEIADRCTFSLTELRYEYPEELCPSGVNPMQYLCQLAWSGARDRYPDGVPDKVRSLLEHELRLIEELRYEAYFLTVWDLVRFARSCDILCQGRGSAANSVVCYCLGVTSVDPVQIDLLFERFVSKERNEAPDIDVDFEHERREEVLQYVYEKYGRERAGMTAEVITYQPRSAIRDVGKALGLSLDCVDRLAKVYEVRGIEQDFSARCQEAGIDPTAVVGQQLMTFVHELLSFPRHLSQHVGGMVMTRGPLCELVPIENAAMPGRTVIEWDKDDLDDLGILKVDCLALGMLTAIHKSFDLIEKHTGQRWTLATVPKEDPDVYAMTHKADTMGVFQIESRAQMSMLPRLKPNCFYDLVIHVAIVRPGPIQGGMVHPYLRRRAGEEEVDYPNDQVREVLQKTLGVPLFQEQAMRLAVVAAGFTPGEADQLRRAMGAWRKTGIIEQFRQKLIAGMTRNGLTAEYAERVFKQISGFGEYGFPESHAASFALLVYVSAWLKRYHQAAFTAALLNSQPMGFYAPGQLIRDARDHGVEAVPPDVNYSDWDCTLEQGDADTGPARVTDPAEGLPAFRLRLGMRLILGLSQAHAQRIERERRSGIFHSIEDFARRTRIPEHVLARLAKADAFSSLSLNRRVALWHALPEKNANLPLFDDLPVRSDFFRTPTANSLQPTAEDLPQLTPAQEVFADYRSIGFSLRRHPLSFLRSKLEEQGVTPASDLLDVPDGQFLRLAGVVLLRQRPGTAKGITFVTLEDETGHANLIIRHEVWQRYRRVAYTSAAWIAHGRLQKQGNVIHLLVSRIDDLSPAIAGLRLQSRDFC